MRSVWACPVSRGAAIASVGLCLLSAVAFGAPQSTIKLGRNVHVSRAYSQNAHAEVLLAADSSDPNHLLGCSIMLSDEENRQLTVAYVSADGGNSWRPTLETRDLLYAEDPACAFGSGGVAYFAALGILATPGEYGLAVYRSTDHGHTWSDAIKLLNKSGGLDREHVVVDQTDGKYHGRLYINAASFLEGIESGTGVGAISLFRSLDGGINFQAPAELYAARPRYVYGVSNSAVLSDGTVVFLFNELHQFWVEGDGAEYQENRPYRPNGQLKAATSHDGGQTFSSPIAVSDYYVGWSDRTSNLPYLAADTGDSPFRDRLYAVWSDRRSGRGRILLSNSQDHGKTWSKPVLVSDDRPFSGSSQGPDDFMPVVAANRDGVVGISWYDRRDNPDDLGWWVRFTASFDGGETFLPSVRVSEAPNAYSQMDKWSVIARVNDLPIAVPRASAQPIDVDLSVWRFHLNGGDTAGIAADAAGNFHPLWVDNRTGVSQVWTAKVTVNGKAAKNGSTELAEFKDLSPKVVLELRRISYDRSSGQVSAESRLKNMSKETVAGTFKLRALSLGSDLASTEILNADNGQSRAGAVWDFSGLVKNNRLLPGESSESKELLFRLSDIRPLQPDWPRAWNLVNLQVRILAKASGP